MTSRATLAAAALAALAMLCAAQTTAPASSIARAAVQPNFELPAQWSAAKVAKLVFDTSVTPHWYSTSNKFWYSYKTSTGTAYYVVDPVKGTKVAMFDHAKLAEQLTLILHLPYDGEHLPITGMRLIRNDTAVQFHVSIPRTAVVPGLGPESAEELRASRLAAQNSTDLTGNGDGGGRGGRGAAGRGAPSVARGNRNVYFEMELATQKPVMLGDFQPPEHKPSWAQISPDGKTIVFSRNHNLYVMDAANYAKALKDVNDASIEETQLTTDGVEFDSYGRDSEFNQNEDLGKFNNNGRSGGGAAGAGRGGFDNPALDQKDTSKNPRKPAVRLIWSRDSSEFVLTKADERKVADLWVIHTLHDPRPILETYKYAMPGEANVPQYSLWVFHVASHQGAEIKADAFADQHFQVQTEPVTNRERAAMPEGQQPPAIWLGGANDKIYFLRISRDLHKVDLCTANPADGTVKPLVEERSNIYIMTTHPVRLVDHGNDLLLWSERDGWGHYYLYGTDGTLKNQIDRGEFVASDIEAVDEATRTLYFTALGFTSGENVYYPHLFRIGLDGTGMRMLDGGANGGNATHTINASDDGQYFVDNYSRVDAAPQSGLFGTAGHLLHLETTDTQALLAAGFQYPTPFTVKADDGITDLYGVMFKPFNFDPHKQYPLIEYVYPGPQTESVETTFNPKSAQMQLAQFGFVVIEVGNRGGSPERDSWYHTYGYHNLRDYGLADKKRAAEELAQMYPFIDINRVGITGHSGGGFMSTAALLEYPDFFKVAVSESGNHDNNVYNNTWSEEHDGIQEMDGPDGKVTFQFSIDKNSDLAQNLKGHLLLSTGDMDNNVHMANTMRLANALIRANKRFDLIMLPGERHGYSSDTEWFFWRKAEYFSQYLLGSAPHGADMEALQREKAENGKGR